MRRRDRYVGSLTQSGADFQGASANLLAGFPNNSYITAIGGATTPALPPPPPPGAAQFSFELWFKFTNFLTFDYALLNKVDGVTQVGYGAESINVGSTLDYFLYLISEDVIGGTEFGVFVSDPPDGWHYYAGTVDQTNAIIYYNGRQILRDSSGLTGTSMVTTVPLLMGYANPANGEGSFLDGALCRVAFYQATVLSAAQVAAHFAASGPGYDAAIAAETGITSYWPLNETSGSVAHDLVGANPGTYVGGHTLASGGPGGSNAVLLDGTTGYVTVPDSPSLNP